MNEIVTDNPVGNANDLVMSKDMADALHAHYPGHLWAVNCNGKTGIAMIFNLALSGDWAYRLKLPSIYSASEFRKKVIMAGGELLERYKMRRGKFQEEEYSGLKTDFAGRIEVHHG